MKILVIVLAVISYFMGAILWYGINREEYDVSRWSLILTTIFWPVLLIAGALILVVVYVLGIIITLIYELIRNIFNK